MSQPFIKWVGGKRQLLSQIAPHLPSFNNYHEPFVGGGALFFHLQPNCAHLSDVNARLIRAYRGVRDSVDRVICLLKGYPYEKNFFLEQRARKIDDETDDAAVAAWFIYLNRTCFNGLYRVNKSGQFNVPFGKYTNPTICDEEALRACSRILGGKGLHNEDFSLVLDRAHRGDLVYFDPPYVPLSATSSFTSYTSDGFGLENQKRLRDTVVALQERGVHVVLSNSSASIVRELYASFKIIEVSARRNVNSKAESRGAIPELLITSSEAQPVGHRDGLGSTSASAK